MNLIEAPQGSSSPAEITFKKRCRTCMKDGAPILLSIFNLFRTADSIADILQQFTNLEIFIDDLLPDVICSECLNKLEDIYQFRDVIIESDTRLRQELGTDNIKTENDPLFVKTEFNIDEIKAKRVQNNEVVVNFEPDIVKVESNAVELSNSDFGDSSSIEADDNDYKNDKGKGKSKVKKGQSPRKPYKKKKKLFSCKECPKTFTNKWNFKIHMYSHTGNYPIRCEICNKGFVAGYALARHKLTHSSEDRVKCDICCLYLRSASMVKVHKQLVHAKTSPKTNYNCQICNRNFINKLRLDDHMLRHTSDTIEFYTCEVCGKDYASKNNLRIHQAIHGPILDLPCTICKKTFRAKHKLRAHIRNVHPTGGPFTCTICQKEYKTLTILKIHQKVHNPSFICDFCGKSFPVVRALNVHLRVHTGETPYACKYCDKKYTVPHAVMVHMKHAHPDALL